MGKTNDLLEGRLQLLAKVLRSLQAELGKGAVALLGADHDPELGASGEVIGIPTGSQELDVALGGVGLPRQRIVEVFGPPSSGKTTLALGLCAATQRTGGVAAYVDVDHGFNLVRAASLGVDPGPLVLAQPDTGDQALFIAEELVRSGAVDLLVVDSVAALVPEAELDGRVGEVPGGLQARLVGQALRRLLVALRRTKTSILLVNHLRPGMDGRGPSTPGGSALPFFAAVRAEITSFATTLDVEGEPSNQVTLRVIKSKLGPAPAVASLELPAPPGQGS